MPEVENFTITSHVGQEIVVLLHLGLQHRHLHDLWKDPFTALLRTTVLGAEQALSTPSMSQSSS
ncbi:hypothetical protein SNOG_01403 [Parastagonospora nodorum SN15]|uniref:Uncharacterized protein n=1 Tax=Phaeosphaeria nodorum (strain SN15 / ATCC MYA-4574 / FGSC 10173) TaxID=321614 RepID=Q0V3L1_PHANO|nr:hypothetical protein SNOG_01403 [Parastagonospora nodorum SN15]EAT91052.1 hypothetical protein SNOG_01403 [Parastagonospora nodorum SN15]